MNIPNFLTLMRLLMVPFIPILFFVWKTPGWALFVYLLAGLTDWLDGYLARRFHEVTSFGMIVDPFADKLMQVTALICLTIHADVPLIFTLLVAVKECCMIAVGTFLYLRKAKTVIPSNGLGKAATALFIVGIVLSFFKSYLGIFPMVILWLAVVVSLIALGKYAYIALNSQRNKSLPSE